MENVLMTIYELLNGVLFGGSVTFLEGSYPDMILTICAVAATLFIICVPFIVVYKVIQLILGR